MERYDKAIEEMPKRSQFKFWFIPKVRELNKFYILDVMNQFKVIGHAVAELADGCFDAKLELFDGEGNQTPDTEEAIKFDTDEIKSEFRLFTMRPECYVAADSDVKLDLDSPTCPEDITEFQFNYMYMLLGCALNRLTDFSKSVEDFGAVDCMIDKFNSIVHWLEYPADFLTSPSSTKFHESFEGGLAVHSVRVAHQIRKLLVCDAFSSVDLNSAVLCALVHDWCKIGCYESYMRNVKNDKGKWEQVKEYKHSGHYMVPMGHGASSLFLARKFFKLSLEESLAIRWHQGRWNVSREELNEFQQSNEDYPLVHLLQFADQLSITHYANNF